MTLRPSRRWVWRSVVAGTILAAVAYGHRRRRTEAASRTPPAITEREVAAFLARRPIDPEGLESVTEAVAAVVSRGDPGPVLGLEGASTASLFLDHERVELLWYVEVPRSMTAGWADPRSTVIEAFPIDHDALGEVDATDRELLVHAANPDRPRTVAGTDGALVAGPGEIGVDVDLVQMRLKPGVAERLADRFASVTERVVEDDLELGPIETASAEMLEAEEMYTESIFLDRREEGYTLCQYMEAAEMAQVYDAYYDTMNPVARVAEVVVGRVLEEPEKILEYPLESDVSLLAHAVSPDRPRSPAETYSSAAHGQDPLS